MTKSEFAKNLHQVVCDTWKNFKHHLDEYDPDNPGKFWDEWTDDLFVMDEAYRDYPERYILFQNLVNGLHKATARMEDEK